MVLLKEVNSHSTVSKCRQFFFFSFIWLPTGCHLELFVTEVGEGRKGNIVGPYGLGIPNERGEELVELAKRNKLIIGITWFEVPKRRR